MTTKYPSVTTICCMHIMSYWFKPGAAERGSKVHSWANNYLTNVWDPFTEEDYPNYVGGLKEWFENNEPKLIFGEKNLINKEFGFTGHADFVGTVKGEDGTGLIDFKTSNSKQPWWKMQLAAYLKLVEANKEEVGIDKIGWCASLRINSDGVVSFDRYSRRVMIGEYFEKFRNILDYYNMKKPVHTIMSDTGFLRKFKRLLKERNKEAKILDNYARYNITNSKSLFNEEGV